MPAREARFSREEFARRGHELYEKTVQSSLHSGDEGKFVAIDIESGEYEVDLNDYAATERLRNRCPDAQIWLMKVGQRAAYRLGYRSIPEVPG
jgi:hypothetical protein